MAQEGNVSRVRKVEGLWDWSFWKDFYNSQKFGFFKDKGMLSSQSLIEMSQDVPPTTVFGRLILA